MSTFYSPSGNPEVWETKPKGYMTPEEWQAAHPAPEPSPEEQAERRKREILTELDLIDRASSRSLRAILTAQAAGNEPAQDDIDKLTGYENEAVSLREELAELNVKLETVDNA